MQTPHRRLLHTLAAACAFALCLPAQADDAANLRPKFSTGQETRYTMEFAANQSTSSPAFSGAEQRTVYSQKLGLLRRVKEASDAGTTIELVVESAKVSMKSGPMMSEDFDSASPPEHDATNQLAGGIRAIIGKPVTIRLGPDGRIASITGNKELIPQGPEGQVAQALVGDEMLRSTLSPLWSLDRAPATATTGQKWQRIDQAPAPPVGTMTVTTDQTLTSIDKGKALIDVSGSIELKHDGNSLPAELKSSSLSGQYIWDTVAGMLERQEVVQKMEMSATLQGAAFTIASDLTVKLARVDPAAPGDKPVPKSPPAPADPPKPSSPPAPVKP